MVPFQAWTYEIVPHTRSVIALDDYADVEIAFNEEWEHITIDEFKDNNNGRLTYAMAASIC